MITRKQLIDSMAEAMSRMEGFDISGSISQKCNNPGNLRTWGNLPVNHGYAVFPTVEEGWAALKSQISTNVWGRAPRDPYPLRVSQPLTFLTFFAGQRDPDGHLLTGGYPGYSSAADNNLPVTYAAVVCKHVGDALGVVGLTIQTVIRSIVNA